MTSPQVAGQNATATSSISTRQTLAFDCSSRHDVVAEATGAVEVPLCDESAQLAALQSGTSLPLHHRRSSITWATSATAAQRSASVACQAGGRPFSGSLRDRWHGRGRPSSRSMAASSRAAFRGPPGHIASCLRKDELACAPTDREHVTGRQPRACSARSSSPNRQSSRPSDSADVTTVVRPIKSGYRR